MKKYKERVKMALVCPIAIGLALLRSFLFLEEAEFVLLRSFKFLIKTQFARFDLFKFLNKQSSLPFFFLNLE